MEPDQLLLHTLKQYWGYDSFRPLQFQIIKDMLQDKDVLAILPTGAGKSLCYQLPAILSESPTLVISPLISLMNDQVQALTQKNIPAIALHSAWNYSETSHILNQVYERSYQIVYCSPERLQSEQFLDAASGIRWAAMVVDEAHCISQWGHDFRPLYRKINDVRNRVVFDKVVALTASAPPRVQEDIIEQLSLQHARKYRQSIVRENLHYDVIKTEHKLGPLKEHIRSPNAIIYCPTRRKTEELALHLNQADMRASAYHAGLPYRQRAAVQNQWLHNNTIICATNAFGMGIDKPDVRQVLHYAPPYSLEAYYQEAGRAGRDGLKARSLLFINNKDIEDLEAGIEIRFPGISFIQQCYQHIADHLQIPVGEGGNRHYIFQLDAFNQKYQLPLLPLLSSIRILEQEGYWYWQQNDRSYNRVRFASGQEDIRALEQYAPDLHLVAIQLLRLYGSIFHYETRIDIALIAKHAASTYEKVYSSLTHLQQLGILEFKRAEEGSSLFWLEDRIPQPRLNKKKIAALKQSYTEQVRAMSAYVENEQECRNKLLAQYFGEEEVADCGYCDNCLKRKSSPLERTLRKELILYLKEHPACNIKNLTLAFGAVNTGTLLRLLQEMTLEGICKIQGTNIIFAG